MTCSPSHLNSDEYFISHGNFQSHDEVAQLLGSSGTSGYMSTAVQQTQQHVSGLWHWEN